MSPLPALKAFLSHRYESPEVNQYFFEIFAERAAVEFDVDRARGAMNVTRFQRMIRSAHGFIGIYPFVRKRPKLVPGAEPVVTAADDDDKPLTVADLRLASEYFRLEIGLAARARKPMLIYVDDRFGAVIDLPSSASSFEFDYRELIGGGSSPNRARFADGFDRFAKRLEAGKAYTFSDAQSWRTNRVGLLLPSDAAYSGAVIDGLQDQIGDRGGEPVIIRWPKALDSRFVSAVESCDFIIMDVGPAGDAGGVPSFLEAWFIPLIRLWHSSTAETRPSPAGAMLYGAFEVGFSKDIVRWSAPEDLTTEIASRLDRVKQEPKRIATPEQAREYFQSAAKRKELVFISYSGADAVAAAPIISAFTVRFQNVFDYKDGKSIRGGRPWLQEIFDTLDRSALAILLVSPSYLGSDNCIHEAQQAIASHDAGRLQVLPVKLSGKSADMPNWLQRLQAVQFANDATPIVDAAVDLLPKPAQGTA